KYSRVKEVFWKTAKMATVVTSLCFAMGMFFPHIAAGIFTRDPELLDMAAKGLRITTLAFPIVGFQMISTNFFQSLGMVSKSVFLSLSRQILFLLPLLYTLPLFFGAEGVWISFPVSDFMASLMTIVMISRLFKKFSILKDGDEPSILGSQL
ncbi:MAG: MATE family efflux transporter, partial [Bacteroidales bacterium]|nr:MATE family efflux transporter [Bacteroidales bacterium]